MDHFPWQIVSLPDTQCETIPKFSAQGCEPQLVDLVHELVRAVARALKARTSPAATEVWEQNSEFTVIQRESKNLSLDQLEFQHLHSHYIGLMYGRHN
jgi:hypothetical protein